MRNYNDKEFILKVVSQDGYALQYASDELRNNKEVVIAAVSNNGWTLKYASKELRNDKDVVVAAVSQNVNALCYASEELRNDREFLCKLYSINKNVVDCIDPKYRDFVTSPSLDDIIDKAESECCTDAKKCSCATIER